jgi:hypothetical protein
MLGIDRNLTELGGSVHGMHHTEEGALSGKRKKSPVLSEKKEKLVTGS